MNKDKTITLQEVRRDPVGFLRQIKAGKTLTVIYHSKPFATVTSGDGKKTPPPKNTKQLLQYAELARQSIRTPIDPHKNYKELYREDMARKYGIS